MTGLCNRTSCPLANSKYATLREDDGKVYLCIKTVERAHSPKNLWEKILLSRDYGKALQQLDEHLAYYPKVMIHRNKQRLTKIHQYLIRMRKLKLKEWAGKKAKMVRVHRKVEQREERREKKAMVAAKLETSIEQELVERLTKGTYGDIYNFPETPYQKVMQQLEDEQEEIEVESEDEEGMMKYVEDLNDDEEDEEEDIEDMGFTKTWDSSEDESTAEMDSDEDDDDEEDEDEDDEHSPTKQKKERKNSKTMRKKKLGPRVEIEYEEENEGERATERQEMTTAW